MSFIFSGFHPKNFLILSSFLTASTFAGTALNLSDLCTSVNLHLLCSSSAQSIAESPPPKITTSSPIISSISFTAKLTKLFASALASPCTSGRLAINFPGPDARKIFLVINVSPFDSSTV